MGKIKIFKERLTLYFLTAISFLLMLPVLSHADVCARVKIEIRQELTLERQAFDAHMSINNGLSHITLENVDVDVNFSDEEGNSVLASSDPDNTDAKFFIRLDSMENIDDVNGSGTVAPSSSADIHWLIIPAPGASNGLELGTLYYVGATLTYTIGGDENVTVVSPDYIYVKPMPELTLDYFLPSEVYGDDAFSAEIEPPIPFSLGVRVRNNGFGVAKSLKIDSAQPKIVDNELGLLIGFIIEGSEVNGEPATESLLVDFGDIEPNTSGMGRWIMICTLSGQFVEFTAEFSHADELGGELTSLIDAVNTHFLVHDVIVDLPGRDLVKDFLAKDGDVYRIYESDSVDTQVTDQSPSSSLALEGQHGTQTHYTLSTPVTAGFMYVQLPDPFNGQKIIAEAVRSDGKLIKTENVWLSKTRQANHSWDYFINLFDVNTTGSYTIKFDVPESVPRAPVLQYIPDRIRAEGQQLSFIIEASDPDGTIPVLSAAPLPAGASFTDSGNGTGIFDWTPSVGQAGTYPITFKASDGILEDTQRAVQIINSATDTDGDGMPDAWEMEHFGTLDRDGTGDFDGDGISDLDEYLYGTDPNGSDSSPSTPVIESPADEAEANLLSPELVISNSTDPDGDTITYEFEVFSDLQLTDLVASEYEVPEGTQTTSWTVSETLNDNTWYYWRVRATDGYSYSLWTYGSFFVNSANDPPGDFNVSSPRDNIEVDTQTPFLQVTNSVDIDEDIITYTFEIYTDIGMSTLVASASDIFEGADGSTSWMVDTVLDDGSVYFWRVVATDEHGAQAETAPASFYINTSNEAPAAPAISSPAVGIEVGALELDLVVDNAVDVDTLSYYFELDKINTFDSTEKQSSGEITEGSGTTSWNVTGLEDNTIYFWRVKSNDGEAESPWVHGSFFVNTANDAPSVLILKNPGQNAWVETQTPTLSVSHAKDPDGDSLNYRFEIYSDEALTIPVAQGESSTPEWIVSVLLSNTTWYYWRAQAEDEHGLAGNQMATASFFVSSAGVNTPPQITIQEPASDLLINSASMVIQWEDSDPDSNADISLYYDTDNAGEDGTLIIEGLNEDPDGSDDTYAWDISSLEGTYYIYATITDGESSTTAYSAGAVTIDRTPPTFEATPAGGSYESALSVTLTADEIAQIYYTTDGIEPTTGSTLYSSPIEISETTTLKFMGVDSAGNQGSVVTQIYTIGPQNLVVTVETSTSRLLSGLRVYAFTEAGSYTGTYATTDENGAAIFDPDNFTEGNYKFRVDYLGQQFWSDIVSLPGIYAVDVIIDEEAVEVTVTSAGGPAAGIRVYLFSESGSYLGIYAVTDENGMVSFYLPVGSNFMFRADILGHQYWSDTTTITGGGTNSIPLGAGGGHLQVTLQEDPQNPMEGIRIYLFSETGSYLSLNETTDSSGQVGFNVSQGTYKVRADYLGYQFWSEDTEVTTDTNTDFTIAHQDLSITVNGMFQGTPDPVEGINVYLFSPSGSYLSQYLITDDSGQVSFHLPQKAYKVRADFLGGQYWSDEFTWQDMSVNIPMADAQVTVTGAGLPREGVNVYLFSTSGSYLNLYETTDSEGKVLFSIPEGVYKFRADYQSSQFWSGEEVLTADQVNPVNISTGGGSFTVTVQTDSTEPITGVNCYVFNEADTYLGMFGATNNDGQVSFELSDGTYKFRVDYMGEQFWSELATVPDDSTTEVNIEEEIVEVTVTSAGVPAAGIRVYLFSESDSYLGIYEITDENGLVSFDLPVGSDFKFRADILGNQYWSETTTISGGGTNSVPINTGGGLLQVTVEKASDSPMEGIKVYLFSETGSYLNLYEVTDSFGTVGFDVPEGTYKVRADYLGYQFWSNEIAVTQDTDIDVVIPHQQVEISVQGLFQGTPDPKEGVRVYLFTPTGSHLTQYLETDSEGKVIFELPQKDYRVRADFLGDQFWADVFAWQNTTVNIPMADAQVTVTGAGFPQEGINVYLFSASGSYLNLYETTDSEGKVSFSIPVGVYKFRADYQGSQFWSAEEPLAADQVNPVIISVGGGTFTFTVIKSGTEPLFGVKCYVFSEGGSYLGISGATDNDGVVSFDLSDGTYNVRVDYLGYQFWSDIYHVPTTLSETLTLTHQDVVITVEGFYQQSEPLTGLKVYLFNPYGSYLGQYQVTEDSGQVTFNLPDQEYKVRVDYLGGQYWSQEFQSQNTTVTINRGFADIHVHRSGTDVAGARVYLFNENNSYLGWYENTDASGKAGFLLPVGSFKFRVDENGEQRWTDVVNIQAGIISDIEVDLD